MKIDLILLVLMVVSALWAVMRGTLLRATIALAVNSIFLSILMFRLDSHLAAVFELSVCAGLITVVFMTTISLTKPLTYFETLRTTRSRIKRFWYLPVIVLVSGILIAFLSSKIMFNLPQPAQGGAEDLRTILWNSRQLDLIGQTIILLIGVFGIAVLFKHKPKTKDDL